MESWGESSGSESQSSSAESSAKSSFNELPSTGCFLACFVSVVFLQNLHSMSNQMEGEMQRLTPFGSPGLHTRNFSHHYVFGGALQDSTTAAVSAHGSNGRYYAITSENFLPHPSCLQRCGFSPVCVRLWTVNALLCINVFEQPACVQK